jgi:hypothetical protein
MKEFMLYIRNEKDAKKTLTPEKHLAFIKKCEVYINDLKSRNKLISAQPLDREGLILDKTEKGWNEANIDSYPDVQVGYYHIYADDLEDAVMIAKNNPEFEYVPSATIEIRPVKTKETDTGFVYPVSKDS